MKIRAPYPVDRLKLPAAGWRSQRLRYRQLHEDDWQVTWEMDSDPQVMRYIRDPAEDPAHHRQEYRQRFMHSGLHRHLYAIEWQQQSGMLGWVLLRPTDDRQWIEVGYRLMRRCWGQGIATEAAAAALEIAFQRWRVDRVMAVTHPENQPSQRVLDKLGFSDQGLTDAFYDCQTRLYVLAAPANN
ncbi:MAG: GNAT family N-acetyltransferase [Wenzhouxiangellaceae bacterium]